MIIVSDGRSRLENGCVGQVEQLVSLSKNLRGVVNERGIGVATWGAKTAAGEEKKMQMQMQKTLVSAQMQGRW